MAVKAYNIELSQSGQGQDLGSQSRPSRGMRRGPLSVRALVVGWRADRKVLERTLKEPTGRCVRVNGQ